jgi:hypothetical protein
MAEGETVINAVIGGVVSIVLSFIPFSPVLGGALAGYLHGGDRGTGARVGGYAGIVAAIPFALFLFFGVAFLGVFAVSGPAAMGLEGVSVFGFVLVAALVVMALYTVGLSALGGWFGNYVRYDTDLFE